MKIAVYVGSGGTISCLCEDGRVRLYDRADGVWTLAAEMLFPFRAEMSLADIRTALAGLVAWLGECRTFVSGSVRGLVYSLLQEEAGYQVWQARGEPEAQLDVIAERDAELAKQRRREATERAFASLFAAPSGGCGGGGCGGGGRRRCAGPETVRAVQSLTEELGDGRYRINLAAILAKYRNANSMDVLVPLLEGTDFTSLEILCNHLPRWFDGKLTHLNLHAEVQPLDGPRGGLSALVTPKTAKVAEMKGMQS
ncbi:MAG: Fe-only nitrogenase accessory protein AnfO [Isosphaeraceae bacterium]